MSYKIGEDALISVAGLQDFRGVPDPDETATLEELREIVSIIADNFQRFQFHHGSDFVSAMMIEQGMLTGVGVQDTSDPDGLKERSVGNVALVSDGGAGVPAKFKVADENGNFVQNQPPWAPRFRLHEERISDLEDRGGVTQSQLDALAESFNTLLLGKLGNADVSTLGKTGNLADSTGKLPTGGLPDTVTRLLTAVGAIPENYGATGDGIADDGAALVTAAGDVAGDGTLAVWQKYRITNNRSIMNKQVNALTGEGRIVIGARGRLDLSMTSIVAPERPLFEIQHQLHSITGIGPKVQWTCTFASHAGGTKTLVTSSLDHGLIYGSYLSHDGGTAYKGTFEVGDGTGDTVEVIDTNQYVLPVAFGTAETGVIGRNIDTTKISVSDIGSLADGDEFLVVSTYSHLDGFQTALDVSGAAIEIDVTYDHATFSQVQGGRAGLCGRVTGNAWVSEVPTAWFGVKADGEGLIGSGEGETASYEVETLVAMAWAEQIGSVSRGEFGPGVPTIDPPGNIVTRGALRLARTGAAHTMRPGTVRDFPFASGAAARPCVIIASRDPMDPRPLVSGGGVSRTVDTSLVIEKTRLSGGTVWMHKEDLNGWGTDLPGPKGKCIQLRRAKGEISSNTRNGGVNVSFEAAEAGARLFSCEMAGDGNSAAPAPTDTAGWLITAAEVLPGFGNAKPWRVSDGGDGNHYMHSVMVYGTAVHQRGKDRCWQDAIRVEALDGCEITAFHGGFGDRACGAIEPKFGQNAINFTMHWFVDDDGFTQYGFLFAPGTGGVISDPKLFGETNGAQLAGVAALDGVNIWRGHVNCLINKGQRDGVLMDSDGIEGLHLDVKVTEIAQGDGDGVAARINKGFGTLELYYHPGQDAKKLTINNIINNGSGKCRINFTSGHGLTGKEDHHVYVEGSTHHDLTHKIVTVVDGDSIETDRDYIAQSNAGEVWLAPQAACIIGADAGPWRAEIKGHGAEPIHNYSAEARFVVHAPRDIELRALASREIPIWANRVHLTGGSTTVTLDLPAGQIPNPDHTWRVSCQNAQTMAQTVDTKMPNDQDLAVPASKSFSLRYDAFGGDLVAEVGEWVLPPPQYDVAGAPSASAKGEGFLIWTTDGHGGSAGPAVSDGANWKQVALGANIAAS